ncbi:MAG: lipid II flippase MurJ [Sphingorhabdus sp.]
MRIAEIRNFSLLTKGLGGATALLAMGLLLGRVSGVVRELMLAARLGTSAGADYAVVLMSLPDLLVNILVAGGLSAVLVPQFKQLDQDAGVRLYWRAFSLILAAFGLFAVLCFISPNLVFRFFAPGLDMPNGLLSPASVALIALAIPLSALSGVSGSYLNAAGRYFMTGLGTLFFNLALIAGLFLADASKSIFWHIALGVAAGAALRLLSQLLSMPNIVWRRPAKSDQNVAIPWRTFFAAVAATTLSLVVPNVVRAAASFTGVGAVASLNYAQKLVELPAAVLLSAITTITLTRVSSAFANGGLISARLELGHKIQLALRLALFATVGSVFFTQPIVELAFGYGAMSSTALGTVGGLFQIGSLGLPPMALSLLLSAYLNATNRTGAVLRTTLVSVMIVPILVLPGILLNSAMLLVWATVFFQIILCCGLMLAMAKLDKIPLMTMLPTLMSKASFARIASGLAVFALAVGLDRLFQFDAILVRLAIMATAFAVAVFVSSLIKEGPDETCI